MSTCMHMHEDILAGPRFAWIYLLGTTYVTTTICTGTYMHMYGDVLAGCHLAWVYLLATT